MRSENARAALLQAIAQEKAAWVGDHRTAAHRALDDMLARFDAIASQGEQAPGNATPSPCTCHDHADAECAEHPKNAAIRRPVLQDAARIPSDMVDGELSVASAIDQVVELFPSADRAALRTLAACFAHHSIYRYTAQPAAPQGVPDLFVQWLEREMPGGTVIGRPSWWAPKLVRALRNAERGVLGGCNG